MKKNIITRRDFLKKTGAAAVAVSALAPLFGGQNVRSKTRVILIRHKSAADKDGNADPKILEQMLDEAVAKLFGTKTPEEAWKKMIAPADIVGIKTNAWKYLRTPEELENILKKRAMNAGVPATNISVDDRGVLKNPVFEKSTVLLNARPMRAHHWAGVGGCLKNYIMFVPKPSDLHPDSCIDLGSVWKLPAVKGKTRLNVLVMLTPQFNCLGPHHFDKEYTWQYNGLIVGTDPVAVDAVGLRIIEAKRRLYFKEDSPLRPPAKHIAAAEEKHGIGTANMNNIELVKLGWKDGALI